MKIILVFLIFAIASCGALFDQSAFSQQVESATITGAVNQNRRIDNANPANIREKSAKDSASERQHTAIAYGGRLVGDNQSARLLIELDSWVEIKPFYMDNPPRLVIDMSKTAFRFQEPENFKPRGLVSDLRYGTMARGQSRVVISLASPVKIIGQHLQPTQHSRYRYTLDLEKIEATEFGEQIARQGEISGNNGKVAIKGDRLLRSAKQPGRLTIVLDPGHGGIDGGARGKKGTVEKDITLAVALRLEETLKASGPFDVFLTRRDDHFLSLKERVKIATRKQADLFISIHADTLRQKTVRGASVYTLSKKASDNFAKNLAEVENRADLIAGLAVKDVQDEIVDILADLTARETKKFSMQFARRVIREFRNNIVLIKNPHRNAAFEVLKDPVVPSVLLELGYLSNLKDEKLLLSNQWRDKFAYHLTEAVGQFFANRIQ